MIINVYIDAMKHCTCADSYIVANRSLSCPIHSKNAMKNKEFGIKELEINWPKVYADLPEPYKNDSCLIFFIDVNGNLCAEDDSGSEYIYIDNHTFSDDKPIWAKIG